MFKKKKKEDVYVINDFINPYHLFYHPYIEKISSRGFICPSYSFRIKNENIATCTEVNEVNIFTFDKTLSEELVKELRPIILKWVEESKIELEKRQKKDEIERQKQIDTVNKELLNFIKNI